MSSRSKKRKAKRASLQVAWEKKVEEVVRRREHARRPERVLGHEYVERIEKLPTIDAETYGRLGPRRIVYLKQVLGDSKPLPRSFVIPYNEAGAWTHRTLGLANGDFDTLASDLPHHELTFTWRAYSIDAGDTRVRWFAPELMYPGSLSNEVRMQSAARKCAAHVQRLLFGLESYHWAPWALEELKQDVRILGEALGEFMGDCDPPETRAEREVSTGAR